MRSDCITRAPRTLHKTGPDTLTLSGDCGFDIGSMLEILEGTVEFKTDAYTDTANAGYEVSLNCSGGVAVDSQNLIIQVSNGATLAINHPMVRIDSIHLDSAATLSIGLTDTLDVTNPEWGGILKLNIPAGLNLAAGDTFNLIPNSIPNGSFDTLLINILEVRSPGIHQNFTPKEKSLSRAAVYSQV